MNEYIFPVDMSGDLDHGLFLSQSLVKVVVLICVVVLYILYEQAQLFSFVSQLRMAIRQRVLQIFGLQILSIAFLDFALTNVFYEA